MNKHIQCTYDNLRSGIGSFRVIEGVSCVDKCKVLGPIQGVSLELICQERPRPRRSSKRVFFFYPFYVQREMYTIPENNTLFETVRDTVPVFVTAKCYTAINCVSNLFSLIPGVMCMRILSHIPGPFMRYQILPTIF